MKSTGQRLGPAEHPEMHKGTPADAGLNNAPPGKIGGQRIKPGPAKGTSGC